MLSLLPIGLFFMKRLDRFLAADQEKEEEPKPTEGPKRVYLSEHSSDEEIIQAVDAFRKEHKHVSIIISEDEKK